MSAPSMVSSLFLFGHSKMAQARILTCENILLFPCIYLKATCFTTMKMKTFYTIRAVIAAIAVLYSRCLVDCFPFLHPNGVPLPFAFYPSPFIFTTFSVSCLCHPYTSHVTMLSLPPDHCLFASAFHPSPFHNFPS